jgi:hypothetical protein
MFESITITGQHPHHNAKPVDLGSLVEAMLLYGKTTAVVNFPILEQIYQYFGSDNLLRLLSEEYLQIVYQESPAGIITQKEDNKEFHGVVQFSSPQHQFPDKLREVCIDAKGKPGAGRRLARKFEKYIRVSRETPLVLKGTAEAILNQRYLESSAQIVIQELAPNSFSNKEFKAYQTDKGIVVETDFDFAAINAAYHKLVSPSHSTITPAYILTHILKLEEELFFASSHLSELYCSNLSSRLGMNKLDYLVERSLNSGKKLDRFQEFFFDDGKTIREAVNAGEVHPDELMKVLERSRRYKEWIVKLPPNADLLKEYFKAIGQKSFIETLPGKILRFTICNGLGIAAGCALPTLEASITGLCLNACDSFLFDKLVTGWKPNQYIEGDLRGLLTSASVSK